MNWPVKTPELTIIKNIHISMDVYEKKVQGRVGQIKNKDDLLQEKQQIWASITPRYVQGNTPVNTKCNSTERLS